MNEILFLISASPRRKELVKKMSIKSEVIPFDFKEKRDIKENSNYSKEESKIKMKQFKESSLYQSLLPLNPIILTCDTCIYFKHKIYGKPKDLEEAKSFLRLFSSNNHKVITGVTLLYKNKQYSFKIVTRVKFNKLSEDTIQNYITKINVLDKAGAYAIQDDKDYHLIYKIKGSYFNVIGFPYKEIEKRIRKKFKI